MNIQFTVGTVNFTGWLHITATRQRDNSLAWQDWFDMPVTSLVFQASGLTADFYKIRFYDSPDAVSLGTLYSECVISGLSPLYEYEILFYEASNLPGTASINGAGTIITDSYLIGKTIHSVEKEGFRKLDLANEYAFDNSTGEIDLGTITLASSGEKLVVVVQNNIGTLVNTSTFAGTKDIAAATYTIPAGEKNYRHRCVGTAATQVVTVPTLASLSDGDFVYIDNTIAGTAMQVKILMQGSDRLTYNGFNLVLNDLAEFWARKGSFVKMMKQGSYYELISDFDASAIGSSFWANTIKHVNTLPGDGRIGLAAYSGDEYPCIWFWLNNVLEASARISASNVNDTSYEHPVNEIGKWVIHPTLKLFRPPNTQGMTMKGLTSYTAYGSDTERPVDNPGGYQADKVKKFWEGNPTTPLLGKTDGLAISNDYINASPGPLNTVVGVVIDKTLFADDNRVKNIGRIELYVV